MYKFLLLAFLAIFNLCSFSQSKRALTVEDLWKIKRIGDVDVNFEEKKIIFAVTSFSMEDNSGKSDLYICDLDGSNLKEFKVSDKSYSKPKFVPKSKKISYLFNKKLYVCDIDGSNEKIILDIYSGISDYIWSPTGTALAFISAVYPDCSNQECVKKKDEERSKSKVKARLITELMYRHWDSWRDEKRNHLFYYDLINDKFYDILEGLNYEVPPLALGSYKDFAFSPDGKEIAFVMNTDKNLALSINNDIFIAKVEDLLNGKKNPFVRIVDLKGNDNQPAYSPDNKYIYFKSMEREGFEADKYRLMAYEKRTGKVFEVIQNFDRTIDDYIVAKNGIDIYLSCPNNHTVGIYKYNLKDNTIRLVISNNSNQLVAIAPDNETIIFKKQRSDLPYEIFSGKKSDRDVVQLTRINSKLLEEIEMRPLQTFVYQGADNVEVQYLLVQPPFFKESEKYPVIFLIHGGPQGQWKDEFHYRWNLQLFASKGYVVVAPNIRGSVGYGQKFTDEVSKDWGGKAYIDFKKCWEDVEQKFPYVDKNNFFAAGASYGGYMINWIATQTDRFNALISMAGLYNVESMYGTTEELWFVEWEFGGPPWEKPELYEKYSPHKYVTNVKTPILLIHGANDFRVTEDQAFQFFTALQRRGVKSKFLYFPDESHFVTKPQNSRLWWNTVFEWINENKK